MKKVISIICVCLICALSFYGCGGKGGSTVQESTAPVFADTTVYSAETTANTADTTAYSSETTAYSSETTVAPSTEAATADASDSTATAVSSESGKDFNMTIGKIQSLSGNTVTVLLADTSSMFNPENMPSGSSDGSRPEFPGGEMPEGFDPKSFFGGGSSDSGSSGVSGILGKLFGSDKGSMPEGFDPSNMPEGFDFSNMPEGFEEFMGGNMPEGFDPNNMPEDFDPESFSGEMPEGFENFADFSGMAGNFDVSSLSFGTETKIYIIPESLKIGDGDYTSLKVGDIIMIMLDTAGNVSTVTVVG